MIPPGYKQTEVGVIPEDWEIVPVSSLLAMPIQNRVFNEPSRKGRGIKLINVVDLYGSFPIDTKDLERFDANRNELLRFGVKHGDMFFTRSSLTTDGIAKCNVYHGDGNEDVVFDCHIIRVRPDDRKVEPFYCARYCNSRPARSYLVANAKTTTMTTIDQAVVANLPIPLPPLPEQRAIATALSDVDALLAALDRLIAKQRDLKQAAMQQLLTGQTRLPGFTGKWETKRVLELGDVVTGGTPRTDFAIFWGDGYPWITPTDISAHRDMFTSERTITRKGLDSIRALPPNTVLVTCIASIGKNAILRTAGACNQQINAVTPNKNNSAEFLYYLFEASKQYLQANAGTTATSIISKAAFAQLTFTVPPLPEQTAIATVLSDMDLELAALEQRRDKTRALKQGMMQELLTGRTRLL